MRNRLLNFSKIITVTLITAFLLTQCKKAGNRQLEEGFANPTIENRPLAFWPWLNGYVDTAKLTYELKEMKDKGMQGAFIWDVGALSDPGKIIPAGPAFLGDKSLGYISLALKTGGRLGLNLGMIASSSWNAGGDWIEEKDASKEMLSVNQIVTGHQRKRLSLESQRAKQENLKYTH